ncbi:MAG: hypothetical protein PHH14_00770 [Candidatus Margulisbacteria bacterium]|nr:hypothetical protein [Candidatus Margulisiibacteriota bacterium]
MGVVGKAQSILRRGYIGVQRIDFFRKRELREGYLSNFVNKLLGFGSRGQRLEWLDILASTCKGHDRPALSEKYLATRLEAIHGQVMRAATLGTMAHPSFDETYYAGHVCHLIAAAIDVYGEEKFEGALEIISRDINYFAAERLRAMAKKGKLPFHLRPKNVSEMTPEELANMIRERNLIAIAEGTVGRLFGENNDSKAARRSIFQKALQEIYKEVGPDRFREAVAVLQEDQRFLLSRAFVLELVGL